MKKLFYTAVLVFTMQFTFAQTQDAITYVNNMGVVTQIENVKTELLPAVEAAKQEEFKKEFDTTVKDFVSNLAKLIDENYEVADIKSANQKFTETKEFTPSVPKNLESFQQKAMELQNEIGITLQGIVIKYADQAMLEAAQE